MSTTNGAHNGNGGRVDDGKVRVAIVGVGNCANSFIQGVEYYKDADIDEQVPGLMHVGLGGYHVRDIEFTAAFDIDIEKVGKDLGEAIWSGQNDTIKFADVPKMGVEVQRGMTHDGLGKYLKQKITKAPGPTADIVKILKDTKTDVLVCYLPVGSEQATKWYVEQALKAGVGFVNCLPVFIAREDYWGKRFEEAGLPIIGDDIKSQVGATIVHRNLARLFHERGVELQHTSQLNVGGNMDFFNMLERERLDSKKISKTNAVTSIMGTELEDKDVHVGPSDYVPWLTDRKWAHIRLEGKSFGDVPLNVELKLEVWDSPNSAGVVIDAVRLIKLALNNGISGQLDGPVQLPDEVAAQPASRRRGARADGRVHRRERPHGRRRAGQGRGRLRHSVRGSDRELTRPSPKSEVPAGPSSSDYGRRRARSFLGSCSDRRCCGGDDRLATEDQIRGLLGDHDRRSVRVAAGDRRHDRCVDDAQAVDAANAQLGIDDRGVVPPIRQVPTG